MKIQLTDCAKKGVSTIKYDTILIDTITGRISFKWKTMEIAYLLLSSPIYNGNIINIEGLKGKIPINLVDCVKCK